MRDLCALFWRAYYLTIAVAVPPNSDLNVLLLTLKMLLLLRTLAALRPPVIKAHNTRFGLAAGFYLTRPILRLGISAHACAFRRRQERDAKLREEEQRDPALAARKQHWRDWQREYSRKKSKSSNLGPTGNSAAHEMLLKQFRDIQVMKQKLLTERKYELMQLDPEGRRKVQRWLASHRAWNKRKAKAHALGISVAAYRRLRTEQIRAERQRREEDNVQGANSPTSNL